MQIISKLAFGALLFAGSSYQSYIHHDQNVMVLPKDDSLIQNHYGKIITQQDLDLYDDTKHKFLDEYFRLNDNEISPTVYTNENVELPSNLHRLVASKVEYPDPDDVSDINNGKMDRYHGNALTGFLTYAHLPAESRCYDPEFYDELEFDIAVMGATFDTGVSYRPGARFGPEGIRLGTRRLGATFSPYRKNFNVLNNWAKIIDCGDPPMTPIDNRIAIDQLYRAERAVLKHKTSDKNPGKVPRILTLGGDHAITFSCIRAAYEKFGKISVIHFDSHLDTVDPYFMNSNVTEYAAFNHGTFLNWAYKKGYLIEDGNMHAGLRGWYELADDVDRDDKVGFSRIMARDIDKIGVEGIITKIKERIGNNPVYISVDIDVLDPSTAPATGTVEPGGWSSRELLSVLDGLDGLRVVGADVVEVSPPFDSGEVTTQVAGEVARSLLALMVLSPVV